jgi:hypothetical protein
VPGYGGPSSPSCGRRCAQQILARAAARVEQAGRAQLRERGVVPLGVARLHEHAGAGAVVVDRGIGVEGEAERGEVFDDAGSGAVDDARAIEVFDAQQAAAAAAARARPGADGGERVAEMEVARGRRRVAADVAGHGQGGARVTSSTRSCVTSGTSP